MTTAVDDHPGVSGGAGTMSHRQVLESLSGLFLAMFVAMLSGTIVANALPVIVGDLQGSQEQYTWVVTATLLAATATTPIWGKLADRTSKKLLVQLAIVVFVLGSVLAGFSRTTGMLIGFRVLQGLGMGGLQALVQIVIASIVSPRQRGRYMGYFGGVMALATVGGPLLGGLIVDTPFLGWRWCFWVGAPIAVVALLVLQKTLVLPVERTHSPVDWAGALLVPGGISVLLIWVTLAGGSFPWASWQTAALVAIALLLIATAVLVERRVADPVIPPRLLKQRTMILAIVASMSVGIAMFGAPVFFGQYFQLSRGFSPAESGLLTLPLVLGMMSAIIITGRLVTRTGRWKRFLVGGTVLIVTGLLLLSTIDHATPIWHIACFMVVMGVGVGSTMQNLVLAVQNGLEYRDLGAGTSTVTFFRTLGGASGVSILGAVLSARVADLIREGLGAAAGAGAAAGGAGGSNLDLDSLPAPVRVVVEHAYGDSLGLIFAIAAGVAVVAFVAVLFLRETRLRTTVGNEHLLDRQRPTAQQSSPTN